MLLPRILVLLIASIFVLGVTAAGPPYNAFLGCVLPGSGNLPTGLGTSGYTRAGCHSACASASTTVGLVTVPYNISFWAATVTSATGSVNTNCKCGLTLALAGTTGSATSAASLYDNGDQYGNCPGSDYTADFIQSPLIFEGCSATSPSGAIYSGAVTSPEQCIPLCNGKSSNPSAFVIPSGTSYTCNCYNALSGTLGISNVACGPSKYTYYSLSSPNPSNAMKKRKDRLRSEKKIRGDTPCPIGLSACKVEGTDAYECLDVTNELESCGGCLSGVFGSNIPAGGQNCMTIPGVAKNGVSCRDNQCEVYSCKFGWKLVGGRCQRLKKPRAKSKVVPAEEVEK